MDPRRFGLSEQDLAALGYRTRAVQPAGPDPDSDPDASPAAAGGRARPAAGDPVRRTWRWTVTILVALTWASSSQRHLPSPVSANRPDTVFSSARAMAQLVEIAQAPRPIGSPEHDRVRDYLVARLRYLGLDPEVQTATVVQPEAGTAVAATVRNIVARLPGTASTGALGIVAHYDGAPLSHGAGDDGVGVAAVLETVRAIVAGAALRNDLVVVLTDAGEMGALGARAFVEHHPSFAELDAVLSVEMRGVSGPAFLIERGQGGGLIHEAAAADAPILASSLARDLDVLGGDPTDGDVLAGRGVPTATLVALGGAGAHGQASDRVENVSERTLQHHGAQLLALTRRLGGVDLGDEALRQADAPAYLPLPYTGVVSYPRGWVLGTTLGILAGWVCAVLLLRNAAVPWRRLVGGVVFGVAAVALSAAGGWGLLALVRRVHPEYGSLTSAVYEDGAHVAALALGVLAFVVAFYALARVRLGTRETFLGAMAVPVGVTVALTLRAADAAAAVQGAVALGVAAAVVVAALEPARRRGGWAWRGFLALAAGMLFWVLPPLELLASALTLRGAPLLAGAFAAALLLFLPVIDWLLRPRWWWAPALATAASAALLLAASPLVREGAHPVRTSLAYLVEGEIGGAAAPAEGARRVAATASALSSGGVSGDAPTDRTRRADGRWLIVPGPGEEWARSWVAQPVVGPAGPGPLFLPEGAAWEIAGSGPPAVVALPSLEVLSDEIEGGHRRLRVALAPGLRGEMLGLRLPEGERGRLTAVGDRTLGGDGEPVRALVHWGRPATDALALDLEIDAGADEVVLEVIEHHLRPTELLGPSYFERSAAQVPDARTGTDRAIQRTRLRVPLRSQPLQMASAARR